MRLIRFQFAPSAFALFLLSTGAAAYPAEPNTVIPAPHEGKGVMKRHAIINENVKKGDAELLFIGDSITQGWEGKKNGAGDVWQKYYGHRHAVNLGIGGDRTQHVLWRLEHGNIDGIKPKLAVLMIGTNNASSNTPDDIAAGVKAIVEKLRAKLPETKVLVLAIFPRGPDPANKARQVNIAANKKIANLDDGKNVFYLDIGPKFLSADGTLSKDIMPDLLHLNGKGYAIWASAIEPSVVRLMDEKQ